VLESPFVLLGCLAAAGLGNLWSIIHVELLKGKPPILRLEVAGHALNLIILAVATALTTLLLGYAFVENFAHR
jgi:hypothetical protein